MDTLDQIERLREGRSHLQADKCILAGFLCILLETEIRNNFYKSLNVKSFP